jgi:hypothetical protein
VWHFEYSYKKSRLATLLAALWKICLLPNLRQTLLPLPHQLCRKSIKIKEEKFRSAVHSALMLTQTSPAAKRFYGQTI